MKKILFILSIFSTVALGVTIKQNISINAFNAGELSPLINSRSDLGQYKVGAKTLQNMVVRSQGPIQRRPGTRYIATAKYNSNTRLINFEYSTELSYIIEVGHEYMRFYRTSSGTAGQIYDGNDPYEISTPYDGNDVFELQFAQDEQYMRIAHPDYQPYKLTRTAHTSWTCTAIDFKGGPFLDENEDTTSTITLDGTTGDVNMVATGGIFDANHVGALWQVSHVIDAEEMSVSFGASADLTESYWTPSGGEVVSPNSPTIEVAKGRIYDFITRGPWYGTVTLQRSYDDGTTWKDVYKAVSGDNGNIQYTGVEEKETADYRLYFEASAAFIYVDTMTISLRTYTNRGIIEISTVTDANNALGTVDSDFPIDSNEATYQWAEGSWSDYRGWPRTICHHEQRCIYGGSESYPETIWGSVIMQKNSDYDNFDAGNSDNDADAWTYKLPGNNPTQWMVSREYLMIGTTHGVGRLGQTDKTITPTFDPIYRVQAINSCAYIQAVPASDAILFVERGGKKIRELTYTYTSERYIAPDMNILAEHITGDGIVEIAFQERPDPILYCVRDDGALLAFTYNRHYGIQSWAKQITDGNFVSVATQIGTSEDEVWAAVERTVNSTDYTYIEQFQPFDWGDDESDMYFVDCGHTDINDLAHLEGETVSVLADGVYDGDYTVSSGSVGASSATNYIVGLPYTSILETMPLVAYDRDYKESSSYLSRVHNLVFDLYETYDFNLGANSTYTDTIDMSELFTGIKPVEFPRGQFREPKLYITLDDPTPFTLRGVTATLNTDYVY